MVFFKKVKSDSSVRGQLANLAHEVGIEVAHELKETGREILRFGAENKSNQPKNKQDWADEWLKDKDPNKPPISDRTGQHSPLDLKSQFGKQEQQELKQVQSRLSQLFAHPSKESEYGQEQSKKHQEASKPVYDRLWQERQEKQQQQQQKQAKTASLGATGSKRPRGDWRHGAKRKHQATPQELDRAEFRGSKGQ